MEPQQARDRPENSWIRPGTWALIDSRAAARRDGHLSRALSRRYGRKIRASLKLDRIERARRVGEAISGHLATGDYKEAWRSLRGWYRAAGNVPQKRCHAAMEQQTKEREALYAAVDPPGEPIPCNVEPTDVEDDAPSDALLREVVGALKNDRAKGAAGMRAEDLKSWLAGVEAEEEQEEEGGKEGAGDTWRLFVELVQSVWNTGEIPRQLRCVIVVLIPKGNSGDYRGIGLMEPIWKVIEGCIERRLQVLPCHEVLHGGIRRKGTGTAIMELKLAQQLAYIEQTPSTASSSTSARRSTRWTGRGPSRFWRIGGWGPRRADSSACFGSSPRWHAGRAEATEGSSRPGAG